MEYNLITPPPLLNTQFIFCNNTVLLFLQPKVPTSLIVFKPLNPPVLVCETLIGIQ
jgi:hypothetical protein